MNPTKNDLPQDARTKLVELLNTRLAEAIDFQTQSKQAHWNVKGPSFYSLHLLFDKISEAAEDAVDDLAERAVELGGTALGTVEIVASKSKLPDFPIEIKNGLQFVEALSKTAAAFGKNLRTSIEDATKLGDADTADLFTEISRESDKYLWMLEAHLHADK